MFAHVFRRFVTATCINFRFWYTYLDYLCPLHGYAAKVCCTTNSWKLVYSYRTWCDSVIWTLRVVFFLFVGSSVFFYFVLLLLFFLYVCAWSIPFSTNTFYDPVMNHFCHAARGKERKFDGEFATQWINYITISYLEAIKMGARQV